MIFQTKIGFNYIIKNMIFQFFIKINQFFYSCIQKYMKIFFDFILKKNIV